MSSNAANNDSAAIVAAFPPPPGVTPNFTNPESIASRVVAATVAFMVLAIAFCVLRLYTSRWIVACWHLDDTFIAAALVFSIIYSVVNLIQTKNGIGIHIWNVPLEDFMRFGKLGAIVGAPAFNLSILCTKISILLFYLRFPVSKAFRIIVYFTMFLTVGNGLSAALGVLYLCRPIPRFWDWSVSGSCVDIDSPFLTTAALNVATDIAILALPIWLVSPLRLPALKKLGVTLILMAGGFVCAVSIVRLAEIPKSMGDPDMTWRYANNIAWAIIEMNVAIICACLPCLKAFVKHHFPNFNLFRRFYSQEFFISLSTLVGPSSDGTELSHPNNQGPGKSTLASMENDDSSNNKNLPQPEANTCNNVNVNALDNKSLP